MASAKGSTGTKNSFVFIAFSVLLVSVTVSPARSAPPGASRPDGLSHLAIVARRPLSPLILFALLSAATFLLLLVLFWRHKQSTYKRRYSRLERSFLCRRCGAVTEQE
jgi:hypothetical protein